MKSKFVCVRQVVYPIEASINRGISSSIVGVVFSVEAMAAVVVRLPAAMCMRNPPCPLARCSSGFRVTRLFVSSTGLPRYWLAAVPQDADVHLQVRRQGHRLKANADVYAEHGRLKRPAHLC